MTNKKKQEVEKVEEQVIESTAADNKIKITNILFDEIERGELAVSVIKISNRLLMQDAQKLGTLINSITQSPNRKTYDDMKKKLIDKYKESGKEITPETKVVDIDGYLELAHMDSGLAIDRIDINENDILQDVNRDAEGRITKDNLFPRDYALLSILIKFIK